MSPTPTPRRVLLWRGFLIAAVGVGILAFGIRYAPAVYRTRTTQPGWSGGPRIQADVGFEPLPDSKLLRSYNVVFNGETTPFANYRSTRPARDVVVQFETRYGPVNSTAPAAKGSMVRVAAGAYSMVGAIDDAGRTLGLVAFDDPKTGGSYYFVGRSKARAKGWRHGDAPGEEVGGIPRPLRSRRVLCVDGLGGITSRLLVYEGFGDISDSLERFETEPPRSGWTRNRDVENVIQRHLPRGTFLSYLKGVKRVMIYIERDPESNKVRTAVAYSEKPWLPPDRGV